MTSDWIKASICRLVEYRRPQQIRFDIVMAMFHRDWHQAVMRVLVHMCDENLLMVSMVWGSERRVEFTFADDNYVSSWDYWEWERFWGEALGHFKKNFVGYIP